jgi:hypothetical protein
MLRTTIQVPVVGEFPYHELVRREGHEVGEDGEPLFLHDRQLGQWQARHGAVPATVGLVRQPEGRARMSQERFRGAEG